MTFSASAQFLNWTYEDILTDELFSGANPDVAIASNGDIYMSFWNEEADQLYFAKREKSTGIWTQEVVASQLTGGFASAIAIDGLGRPHIAFFENVNEEADLMHAVLDGTWQIEYISKDTLWGPYRRDFELTSYRNPSIDLTFDTQGNPVIAYFDAKVYTLDGCAPSYTSIAPGYYEMDLNIAVKSNNNWQIIDLDLPLTTFPNCVRVPDKQDRFGEFCKILASGDSFMVVTNALYNHDLMLFTSSPTDINNWKGIRIDSVERTSTASISYEEGFHFPEISVQGDSVLHISYGLSKAYGLLATSGGGIRNFFYTQIDLRNPSESFTFHEFVPPPRDNHMRSFFALSSISADSIYLAYYDLSSQDVVLTVSKNQGSTWINDTVFQAVNTNAPLVCEIIGDSLFVGLHNTEDQLFELAARHINGGPWRYGLGTTTQQRAYVFSSVVEENATENIAHFLFDDKVSGELTYGTGTPGNWQYETLRVSEIPYQAANLIVDKNTTPWAAFTLKNQPYLYLADNQGGSWNIDSIVGDSPLEYPLLAYTNDSIHAVYLDRRQQMLMHAISAGNGNWQVKTLDSLIMPGRKHAMTTDLNGRIHLAYVQNPGQRIIHSVYENGTWSSIAVTDSGTFTPKSLDIKTRSDNGRPTICFRDIIPNEVLLTEQQTDTIWRYTRVLIAQQNTLGKSLHLILDPKNNPWILYSFISNSEEIRLLRRENDGFTWQPVTVNNNPGKIAGEFDFHLVANDFYLLGRKTRPIDRGIAMLYAPEGVTTEIASLPKGKLMPRIFPNPTASTSTLEFENSFPQSINIDIFDVQGRIVGRHQLLPNEKSLLLRTESLQTGLYIVHISNGAEHLQLKWIIMN
jgi:hypothetical protein